MGTIVEVRAGSPDGVGSRAEAKVPGTVPSSHTLAGVLSRIQRGVAAGEDPELARRLDEAFAKHEPDLRRRCRKLLPGFPEAQVEEVVQDVLVDAWAGMADYVAEKPFRAFLWGIARNRCANARRRRSDVLVEDGVVDPESGELSVLARLAAEERDQLVEEAARNVLDAREQELVQLRWVLDHSRDEVAARLGYEDTNEVRKALQNCTRRLQRELERLVAERGLGASFLGKTRKR